MIILKHQKREDDTWNVKIRITQNRQSSYMSTSHYVGVDLVNKKTFQLKERDNPIYDEILLDVLRIRKHLSQLGHMIDEYTAKELCKEAEDLLAGKSTDKVNFFDFAYKYAANLEAEGRRIGENYRYSIGKFETFAGTKDLCFSDITSSLLKKYEDYLRKLPARNGGLISDAGIRLYTTKIQAIFNRAKEEFNDEDRGIIKISNNPFGKYKPPKNPVTRKRSLAVDQVLSIRDYKCSPSQHGALVARDAFMMSFILVGMNTVDLYYANYFNDGRIEYERRKTRTRRQDKAFISIKTEPELQPYLNRYKDELGDRVFNFFERYGNPGDFNRKVNMNLKTIGNALGIDNLTFYAARHTWATVARNECGVSMDDIAVCLNHISGHDVTDTYIKKDWSIIDKANRKVLDFIFGEKEKAGE